MAYNMEDLRITQNCIDDKWVIARPVRYMPILWLLRDLWLVITGKADVVRFYKQ